MSMRAVTYGRVSTAIQAEQGYSLGEQERALAEFCNRNNCTVVEHVADEGVSGKLADRPGLLRIREMAEAKAIDAVVVVKLDRLARRNWIAQQFIDWLSTRGVKVFFVEHASGDKPSERLLVNVLGGVAEFEHEQIRERTLMGRYAKARAGKVPSNAQTFGYRMVTKAQALVLPEYLGMDGAFMVHEDEAAIVREVFSRYLSGAGCSNLVRWLNEMGFRTRRGNHWSRLALRDLLRNPAYIGQQFYGKAEWKLLQEGGRTSRMVKERPREEWVLIPCPPILDEQTFYAVQARLQDAAEVTGRPSHLWLLRGVVFCGVCRGQQGQAFGCHGRRHSNSSNRAGYTLRYYRCNSRSRAELPYCGTEFNADKLETIAWDALTYILRPGILAKVCRHAAEDECSHLSNLPQEVEWLEKGIRALEEDERRLMEAVIAGVFSAHLVKERATEIQRNRAGMLGRLEQARASLAAMGTPREVSERAEVMAAEARAGLQKAQEQPERLQELYRNLLRISIAKGQKPRVEVALAGIGVPAAKGFAPVPR
jgi:site-specific DNA recombinase